jgi:hypothetical protein
MQLDWDKIIPAAIATYILVKKYMAQIEKIAEPLVRQVEVMAQDGVIDKAERKQLVLTAVSNLEAQGKVKLSFLQKILLKLAINYLAKRLPDFYVGKEAKDALNELVK